MIYGLSFGTFNLHSPHLILTSVTSVQLGSYWSSNDLSLGGCTSPVLIVVQWEVLRRQPHCRSGLATLPSVGAVPQSLHSISVHQGTCCVLYVCLFIVLLYFVLFAFSGFSLLLQHFFLQYFDTVGWVFCPVKLSQITYTVLVETLNTAQSVNQSVAIEWLWLAYC